MIASKMKLRWWFIWYLCTWCGSYDGFIFFVWVNFFHLWRDGKNFQFRTFFLYHKLCELKQFMKKRSDESKSNNGQQWIKSIFHPRTTMDQQKKAKKRKRNAFLRQFNFISFWCLLRASDLSSLSELFSCCAMGV